MQNRKSIDALALAVCIVATGFAILSVWELPPKVESRLYGEVGRAMAQEALTILPKGGRVIVIARDTTTYRQPAMEIGVKEFEREVIKGGAEVSIKYLQVDPLRPVEVPPGDFFEAIRRAKTNDVIVSLLGPPVLEPAQEAKLNGPKPKIIALCTGSMSAHTDLGGLARRGLLYASIVNRSKTADPNKSVGNLTFEELYTVVRHREFAE